MNPTWQSFTDPTFCWPVRFPWHPPGGVGADGFTTRWLKRASSLGTIPVMDVSRFIGLSKTDEIAQYVPDSLGIYVYDDGTIARFAYWEPGTAEA